MLSVIWQESRLPAMLAMTAALRTAGSRLSCQITLGTALQGLRVTLPPTQY